MKLEVYLCVLWPTFNESSNIIYVNSKPAPCLSSETFGSLLTTSCFEFLDESIDNHINNILINLYNLNITIRRHFLNTTAYIYFDDSFSALIWTKRKRYSSCQKWYNKREIIPCIDLPRWGHKTDWDISVLRKKHHMTLLLKSTIKNFTAHYDLQSDCQ